MPNAPPKHQPIGVQTWRERKAAYIASRPSPSRIYDRRWQKLRLAYLASHPLCECGCLRPAAVVHHRKSHTHHGITDTALLLDWDNLQALTKQCHDKITAAEGGGFGNPSRQ